MAALEHWTVQKTWPSAHEDSTRTWAGRGHLFVSLRDGEHFGLGEAAPLPGRSKETLEEVHQHLQEHAESIGRWLPEAQEISAVALQVPTRLPSLRFALETAWLDLQSRKQEVPLWKYLGAKTTGFRSARLCGWIQKPEDWPSDCTEVVKLKWDCATVPLGEALGAVRKAHPDQPLRIDANSSLEPAWVSETYKLCKEFGIEFLEEPCAADCLPLFPPGTPLILAADESLENTSLWHAVLSHSAIGYGVLKPTILGGVVRAQVLARKLRAAGKQVVWSHAVEGPVAYRMLEAMAHADGARSDGLAMGLGVHPGLRAFSSFAPHEHGVHLPWDGEGLGLSREVLQ